MIPCGPRQREEKTSIRRRVLCLTPYSNLSKRRNPCVCFSTLSDAGPSTFQPAERGNSCPAAAEQPSWGAAKVRRRWIIRRLLRSKHTNRKRRDATHAADGGFRVEEEQLHGDDVLQLRDAFYIKPGTDRTGRHSTLMVKREKTGHFVVVAAQGKYYMWEKTSPTDFLFGPNDDISVLGSTSFLIPIHRSIYKYIYTLTDTRKN